MTFSRLSGPLPKLRTRLSRRQNKKSPQSARKATSDARADKAKKVREVEEATRKECKEILCREMAMARRG